MNWLDIVIVSLLLLAVWQGWREGVVTQILGLAALILGIYLGWRYGVAIGLWMGLDEVWAHVAGFCTVLAAVLAGVWLIGRLTRGLFHVAGLGMFDNLLGALFSALKMAIFVGLIVMLFELFDPEGRVITEAVKDNSRVYGVVERVFNFVKTLWVSGVSSL